jgi:hypothetical protein
MRKINPDCTWCADEEAEDPAGIRCDWHRAEYLGVPMSELFRFEEDDLPF